MVKLRTLGESVAEIGSTRLGPDAERLFALLLCLAIEGNRLSSRSALTSLLWPDVPEDRAGHSLRQAVYRLRALGVPVQSDRSALWIEAAELQVDCAPLLAQAPEPDGYVHELRGSFLHGYHPRFSDRFGEWLDRQRDLVNARIRRVFLSEIGRLKARGDWTGVECMAARCLAIDPLNEEATLAKAEAAALQGGKAQALAILDGYLKEVGPQAREIRLPASVLRRRIAEATHLERPRAITETPFFGRAVEMALLNRSLQMAHAGSGSAHLFWGEPGIGKTRLMQEFSRAVSLGHARLVRVGCQSNDDRRPLSMFVDMLPRLMALPGALGCAPAAMRHLRRLTEHDPKEPLAPMDARDAALIYANIRRALLDLLDAVAGEGLLVLIIEDVHWLDMGSWDVIADSLSWLGTRRVLLLLTAREPDAERKRGIGELPGLQRHHLPPLERAAVDALSATLVARSGTPMAADVAEWCATSCGGNPYHLTELVLHGLREGRTARLPASLSQLIAERLARLQPLALHVLQGVSILGAHSTLDRLERLLDQRRLALVDALDELERSGLIESEPARLVSKHDLLSQAAVQRLSMSARRLLHRHAATVLERDAGEDHVPALQWACAEHWREAGEVGRALAYLEECARFALESGSPADALELLDRARSLTRGEVDRKRLIRERAAVLAWYGRWQSLAELIQESEPPGSVLERDLHDEQELRSLESLWRSKANYGAAIPHLLQCIASVHSTAGHKLRAATLCLICCDNTREVAIAHRVFKDAKELFRTEDLPRAECLRVSTVYHASFGDVEQGAKDAQQLRHTRADPQTAEQRARDLMLVGTALRAGGDECAAKAVYGEAFRICTKHNMDAVAGGAALSLASLLHCQDKLEESAEWLDRADSIAQRAQDATLTANLLGVRVRRALYERDASKIPGYFAALEALASHRPRRFGLIIESAQIRYAVMAGLAVSFRDARDKLLALHLAFAQGIGNDYIVVAICELFGTFGDGAGASQFAREFAANDRRERSSIPPELSRYL